eukprot:gene31655-15589_t
MGAVGLLFKNCLFCCKQMRFKGRIHELVTHHHRQINPYRAINDAINVHPFEFISGGSYLHMLTMWVVGKHALPLVGCRLHLAGLIGWSLCGSGWETHDAGDMETVTCRVAINHTRWIVRIPFIYDTRTHDTHHKFPRSNYGQQRDVLPVPARAYRVSAAAK